MTGRILVLGAAGRLGYAAAQAFRDAGWAVVSFVRPGGADRAPPETEILESVERSAIVAAARGADVVLNALNVPFPQWRAAALPFTYLAIEAAEAAGATLLFPANLYNYGRAMPEVLDEATPMNPASHKGRMREHLEMRIREAAERGVRAIIFRAGDFFGSGRGSWFDLVITRDLNRGRITYPGPLDVVHEWAYLPDLAVAMVRLAERRHAFGALETFGFAGHAVTGRQMTDATAHALRRDVHAKRMGWWMVKSVGRLFAMGRELAEVEYLWRVPHRISGEKLEAAIGAIPHTPFEQAVAAALRGLGYQVG